MTEGITIVKCSYSTCKSREVNSARMNGLGGEPSISECRAVRVLIASMLAGIVPEVSADDIECGLMTLNRAEDRLAAVVRLGVKEGVEEAQHAS